ncbi:hypothetical protein ACFE04_024196 [Oxalis oulophora]
MGNCQAIDAAALVIQHPCGKIERFYSPIPASEVMKMNPGHYVSLIIPLPISNDPEGLDHKIVRFTRVKLLRATDTLALGHAYRLVTTQAKKYAKSKRQQAEAIQKLHATIDNKSLSSTGETGDKSNLEKPCQEAKQEQHSSRTLSSNNSAVTRSKSWRPKLQSISEAGNLCSTEVSIV